MAAAAPDEEPAVWTHRDGGWWVVDVKGPQEATAEREHLDAVS